MRREARGFPVVNKERTAARMRLLMYWSRRKPEDIRRYLDLTCVQTVYRWMEGINIPSVDNMYALSRLFDVQMDELVFGDRIKPEANAPRRQGWQAAAYYYKMVCDLHFADGRE